VLDWQLFVTNQRLYWALNLEQFFYELWLFGAKIATHRIAIVWNYTYGSLKIKSNCWRKTIYLIWPSSFCKYNCSSLNDNCLKSKADKSFDANNFPLTQRPSTSLLSWWAVQESLKPGYDGRISIKQEWCGFDVHK